MTKRHLCRIKYIDLKTERRLAFLTNWNGSTYNQIVVS
jgi:hypothetical protein